MQNYLFVDIDGPLLPKKMHMFPENVNFLHEFNNKSSRRDVFELPMPMFDPWGVYVHNTIAKYAQAKVVVVSNWRRWWDLEVIQDVFFRAGLEFEYAENPSCMRRGMSSERCHDVALHMEDFIEPGSRVLILDDDHNLQALNLFFPLEGETSVRNSIDAYHGPQHKDEQIGIVKENNVRWRWLDVDYDNGISYSQFVLGLEFFGLDAKTIRNLQAK